MAVDADDEGLMLGFPVLIEFSSSALLAEVLGKEMVVDIEWFPLRIVALSRGKLYGAEFSLRAARCSFFCCMTSFNWSIFSLVFIFSISSLLLAPVWLHLKQLDWAELEVGKSREAEEIIIRDHRISLKVIFTYNCHFLILLILDINCIVTSTECSGNKKTSQQIAFWAESRKNQFNNNIKSNVSQLSPLRTSPLIPLLNSMARRKSSFHCVRTAVSRSANHWECEWWSRCRAWVGRCCPEELDSRCPRMCRNKFPSRDASSTRLLHRRKLVARCWLMVSDLAQLTSTSMESLDSCQWKLALRAFSGFALDSAMLPQELDCSDYQF